VAQETPYERYKLRHGHLYQTGRASEALVILVQPINNNSEDHNLDILEQLVSEKEMRVNFSEDGYEALSEGKGRIELHLLFLTRTLGKTFLPILDQDIQLLIKSAMLSDVA